MKLDFSRYYERVGSKPTKLAVRAMALCHGRGPVLDLGAGNLRDSKYALESGFERVVAVDPYCQKDPVPAGIEYHRMPLQEFTPPIRKFDLVLCCNTFYFLEKEDVCSVVVELHAALRDEGVFAFDVLGYRDSWTKESGGDLAGFCESEIRSLRSTYSLLELKEEEFEDRRPSGKIEHRHLWNLILRE